MSSSDVLSQVPPVLSSVEAVVKLVSACYALLSMALPAFQGSLLLAFDPTASGKRPAIVYCSHGVSEEHRKRQKGSGELDGSAHAVSPAHNCILR